LHPTVALTFVDGDDNNNVYLDTRAWPFEAKM
jgi:hypothetical protein